MLAAIVITINERGLTQLRATELAGATAQRMTDLCAGQTMVLAIA